MKPQRKRPVCIYVDNSNIYISGQEIAASKGEDKHKFRIDFRNFLLLLTQGTLLFEEMTWGGSGSDSALEVLEKVKQHGADVQFLPRSENPEHETVDAFIQLTMYRQARKYRQRPGTMILCSGDGKGFAGESGFLYDLAGFKEDGWDIEVYSWDRSCHEQLKVFATSNGRYHSLEKFYDSITFIENGRNSVPL